MLTFLATIYLLVGLVFLVMSFIGWYSMYQAGELSAEEFGFFFFAEMTIHTVLITPAELLLALLEKIRNGHKE